MSCTGRMVARYRVEARYVLTAWSESNLPQRLAQNPLVKLRIPYGSMTK